MGRDRTRYEAVCQDCGTNGVKVVIEDDWCRTTTHWEGFSETPPNANAVAGMKVSPRDKRAICGCGSNNIKVVE